jgi:hypothetical protein
MAPTGAKRATTGLPDALGLAGDQQRVPDALVWPLQQVGKEVQHMREAGGITTVKRRAWLLGRAGWLITRG